MFILWTPPILYFCTANIQTIKCYTGVWELGKKSSSLDYERRPVFIEDPMDVSLETSWFSIETPRFHWIPPDFIGDLQILVGDPIFSLENPQIFYLETPRSPDSRWRTPFFIGDSQIFTGDPKILVGDQYSFIEDPHIFAGGLKIFIGDPIFSLETPLFSLETPQF